MPTLESVKRNLDQLRKVARDVYAECTSAGDADSRAWTLGDYLEGIDELEKAINHALEMPEGSMGRLIAEKRARNVVANALYYRGRIDLKTGRLGVFYKKVGEKSVHWAPTELSRQADRIACEPLRHIYKETEKLLHTSNR